MPLRTGKENMHRPCKICGEMFENTGKRRRVCNDCIDDREEVRIKNMKKARRKARMEKNK